MESLGWKSFCAKTPHFFKIILEDTSRDYKLMIPKKFVIKYAKDLSNLVCLKLPSGSEWEVELTRCNGNAWFERGWLEFSRFCSLKYSSFLVFRYEGNSHFEVFIFDKSATEIDYPLAMPKIEEAAEDDVSIKILEDLPSWPKRKEKSSFLFPSCKKMKTSRSGRLDMISENGKTHPYARNMFEKPMTDKYSHCSKAEIKGKTDFATKNDGGCSSRSERVLQQTCNKNLGRMEPLTTTEKAIALQRANAFKSDKPSFKMAIQPSHIYHGTIDLPYKFSKRYFTKLSAGIAILRVSVGKTWSMKFKYECKNSRAQLSSGWSHFVQDNDLKVGDVCVFVLTDNNELLFEVFFFPTIEATNHPPGFDRAAFDQVKERSLLVKVKKLPEIYEQVTQKPSSSLRASRVTLEAANKFVSENPFFTVHLHSIHNKMKYKVNVPASLFRTYFNRKKQTVKLQVEDRWWPVNLVPNGLFAGRLCAGWLLFAKEHCLKDGDVCIFELMEMNESVLKVHIFRC